MTEKYALLDSSAGHLVNTILWDGDTTKWQPPAGVTAVKLGELDVSFLPPAPPAPLSPCTAEQWMSAQGYGSARTTLLLYLRLMLTAAGKDSGVLTEVQAWIDQIIGASVGDPDQTRADWPLPPHTFAQAHAAAVEELQQ